MREFITLVESQLDENPIDNFEVIGEPQPGRDGAWKGQQQFGKADFTPGDHKLLTSEKGVQKIRDAFSKTPFVFDIYIFISGDMYDTVSANGGWSKKMLETALGRKVETEGRITICMSNNVTNKSNYVPTNYWALAHRTAHDFQIFASNRAKSGWVNVAEAAMWVKLTEVFNTAFTHHHDYRNQTILGIFPSGEVMTPLKGYWSREMEMRLPNLLFTMRSARMNRITNSLDAFPELFAQYLFTGGVRLRRVEQWDMERFLDGLPYFYKIEEMGDDPAETLRPKGEMAEKIDAILEQTEDEMNARINDLLTSMVGGVWGW